MPTWKEKTLHYRSALWFRDAGTLESQIRSAIQKLPTAQDRTIEAGEDHYIRCLSTRKRQAGGIFLHITADTPGEAASTVPKALNTAEVNVGSAPPPADAEFMDGDAFAFIRDDHVCFCSGSGLMREGSLQRFLVRLFEKADLGDAATSFTLEQVADAEKIALIEAQGVKRIDLNASVYAAATHYARRQGPMASLRQAARSIWASLQDDDDDHEDNLLLRVSIHADGRIHSNEELGFDRLEEIARQVIEGQQEGDKYTIITRDDQRIGPEKVMLQKSETLPAAGKSISREPTWTALLVFFNELAADHRIIVE